MTEPVLYLLSPPQISDLAAFTGDVEAVLAEAAGSSAAVACLQLRLKGASDDAVLTAAEALLPICQQMGTGFLINDRPDLAQKSGADGVHIGQSDMSLAEARSLLGPDKDIGVTCHGSVHLAMEAGEAGADYVAFGAFQPSATKETAHQTSPDILTRWQAMATLPSVAIGGITPGTAKALLMAGADYVAVCGAVWNHGEGPRAAVRSFAEALA